MFVRCAPRSYEHEILSERRNSEAAHLGAVTGRPLTALQVSKIGGAMGALLRTSGHYSR